MNSDPVYPGTPQQKALLKATVQHYADDLRILAVTVFGSLGRGNWDQYSDLDLDIVIADNAGIEALPELKRLCTSFEPLGERALIIVPDGEDAGDVVLASLMGLSVRYHRLHTTSPNIVDSLLLLSGRIEAEAIKAAGLVNRSERDSVQMRDLEAHGLDEYVRLAVNTDICLQRRQFWRALQMLNQMREYQFQAFALTHGGGRPYHIFQAEAPPELQERIGATLPRFSLRSAQEAFTQMLDMLENDLSTVTNGLLQLSDEQREVIAQVRKRQRALIFAD